MFKNPYPKVLFVDLLASGVKGSELQLRRKSESYHSIEWEIRISREGISPVASSRIVGEQAIFSSLLKTKALINYWTQHNHQKDLDLIDLVKQSKFKDSSFIEDCHFNCMGSNIHMIFQSLNGDLHTHSIFGTITKILTCKKYLYFEIKTPFRYFLCPYNKTISYKQSPCQSERDDSSIQIDECECQQKKETNCFYIYDDLEDYFERDRVKTKITEETIPYKPIDYKYWRISLYQFK